MSGRINRSVRRPAEPCRKKRDDPSNWWGRSVAGWGASPSARGGVTGYWSVVLRPLGSSESKGPKQPSGACRPGNRAGAWPANRPLRPPVFPWAIRVNPNLPRRTYRPRDRAALWGEPLGAEGSDGGAVRFPALPVPRPPRLPAHQDEPAPEWDESIGVRFPSAPFAESTGVCRLPGSGGTLFRWSPAASVRLAAWDIRDHRHFPKVRQYCVTNKCME